MNPRTLFEDIQLKIADILRDSPVQEVKQQIDALFKQGLTKLDIVSYEEFDTQKQVLERTRTKLEALEARVALLEGVLNTSTRT